MAAAGWRAEDGAPREMRHGRRPPGGRPRLEAGSSRARPKPLLAKLREQQPDLAAGNKEVREALAALKAKESKAPEATSDAIKQHMLVALRLQL